MSFSSKFRLPVLHLVLVLVSMCANADVSSPSSGPGLSATIQYLLNYVSGSGYTYVRNGNEYTAAEAAAHMQKKYHHFRDRISTPEQFIEYAASRSLLSGKPYWVLVKGRKIETSPWLLDVLAEYRVDGNSR